MKDVSKPYSRGIGSQGEAPTITNSERGISVGGYQGFEISNRRLTFNKVATEIKYLLLRPYISRYLKHGVIADIGCSAGAVGLKLLEAGAERVVFIDHDPTYTDVVTSVVQNMGLGSRTEIHTEKVGQCQVTCETGIALALVHWLYSYSESFGSLYQIIRALKKIASKTLIVEWVSPDDSAIRSASHLAQNIEVHRSPYSEAQFINALAQNYTYYKRIGRVSSTRNIWIASEEPILLDKRESISLQWNIIKIRWLNAILKLRKNLNRRSF